MDSIAELGRKIIGEKAEIEHRSAVLNAALVNANNWLTHNTTVNPTEVANANTYIDIEVQTTNQTTAVDHDSQSQPNTYVNSGPEAQAISTAQPNSSVPGSTETSNQQDNVDYLISARRAVEDAHKEVN